MMSELFKGLGVEITLPNPDDFNIIKETLTRMGIASYKNGTLSQTCHIFHRQGRYSIMHFKEMLAFDGKDIVLNEDSEFINKGKFVSIETCRDWSFQSNFFFFWTHNFDGVYTDCTSVSRILTLPVGSIRQVLSI